MLDYSRRHPFFTLLSASTASCSLLYFAHAHHPSEYKG